MSNHQPRATKEQETGMKFYQCKLCGHVSSGVGYQQAAAEHRKHYHATHHDGQMRLWSALPRRINRLVEPQP